MFATKREMTLVALCLLLACAFAQAQRDGDGDDDDFDDSGFNDSGYNNPNREAEGSSQNPSSYSPVDGDDLDDDDDVDETHMSPQVAPDSTGVAAQQQQEPQQQQQQQQQQHQQQQVAQYGRVQPQVQLAGYMPAAGSGEAYYANVAPQRFYAPPNSVLLANVEPGNGQTYSHHQQPYRYRRSTKENDVEDKPEPLVRHKRHSKYIGPVYTYVKTDKHARYKWGVKHKVGKHHG